MKEGVEKAVGDVAWKGLVREWVALQPKLSDAGPFAGYTYLVSSLHHLQLLLNRSSRLWTHSAALSLFPSPTSSLPTTSTSQHQHSNPS